jgi:hypothetical protein
LNGDEDFRVSNDYSVPQTTARENSGIFLKGYCLEIICSAIPRHKRDWDWLLAEGLFDLKLVAEV